MGAIYDNAASLEETVNVSILSTDVAADQARLEELGAGVVVAATQVSDVTTFSRMSDPAGNVFSLFANNQTPDRLQDFAEQGQQQMEQLARQPTPGSYAWFEIGTTDPKATEDFYGKAFGWRFVFDDTAGGKQYYNIFTGNQWPSGGMYDHVATGQGVNYLMPCFLVTEVPATTAKAEKLGATAEFGPDTNPDGLVYSRLVDPRGNRFGLLSAPTNTQNA
ncbi:MAG: VOC family protein [Actinomycetota bacterium]|nr:VOC family protein [Actinomycetota bacterium]